MFGIWMLDLPAIMKADLLSTLTISKSLVYVLLTTWRVCTPIHEKLNVYRLRHISSITTNRITIHEGCTPFSLSQLQYDHKFVIDYNYQFRWPSRYAFVMARLIEKDKYG
jgi:hypothetical protein